MTDTADFQPGWRGRIGAARADITPPTGIYARNWGAARHDAAEGIHRPLTATALSLRADSHEPPALLLSLDLGWWRTPDDEWSIRSALLEQLSLASARVLVALTHTHAGPSICRADSGEPGGDLVGPYLDGLRETVVRVARQAMAREEPAWLEWAVGRCDLARNRDLPDPARDRLLCGAYPGGETDDTVLVGRAASEDGRTIATVVNYACHPTTLAWENRSISPDYVGGMRDIVEAAADGAPCLFLQGASGDLAPRMQYTGDPGVADRNGRQLGHAAVSALLGMLPPGMMLQFEGVLESGAPLGLWGLAEKPASTAVACRQMELELPLQPWPSVAELDERLAGEQDRALVERLRRKRRIRAALGDGSITRMPFWVWRLGDACLLAIPNEAYSSLQRTLRRRLPRAPVIVATVVNGHTGYLPPDHLYDANAYPVWQTPYGRGSLERLTEAAAEALELLMQEERG